MLTNKALTSDSNIEATESGTIIHARNRILSDGYKVSENEDGFTIIDNKDSNIVGACNTNKGIVYISTELDGAIQYFIISLNSVTILRTQYIEWNSILATEILYKINDNGELIIVFWNGVDVFSNRPRLINLDVLPFTLDNNKEIIDETINSSIITASVCAERSLLFPIFEQVIITPTVDYNQSGNIVQGRYAFCIKYHIEGGTTQSTIPCLLVDVVKTKNDDIQYHTYQEQNQSNVGGGGHAVEAFGKWKYPYNPNQPNDTVNANILLNITNIDIKYKLLDICIIKVIDDVKITVDSIENIAITGPTLQYKYTGITSSSNIDTSGILNEYLSFDKIQSGCILRDSLYLYNTKQDSSINYQKYANNIVVGWDFKRDTTGKLIKVTNDSIGERVVMPNDVYGFNIHLVLNNGTITEGFHIPGRLPENTENDYVEDTATYMDKKASGTAYKKFQLNPFVTNCYNPSYIKDTINPNKIPCGKLAYWHNENEQYYFENSESSEIWDVDSNGVGVNTGVSITDTVTNVRHHRFPNLESIYSSIPHITSNDTLDYSNRNIYPYVIEPVFSNIKIPSDILHNIKGYVISYIVKEFNDNLIAGVAPVLRYYPVNNVSTLNQITDRPDDKDKLILFDFTLQNKMPKININLLRVEYQLRAGKDEGGYGYRGKIHPAIAPFGVNTNMPIPTDGYIDYPDVTLGNNANGNVIGENTNNMTFGINFDETAESIVQTAFTVGQERNVKFIHVEDFEYLQENNLVQENQYRGDSIKCKIKYNCFTTPRMQFPNFIPTVADLNRDDRLTFPQSNIYHGTRTWDTVKYNTISALLGTYPLHFFQSARRWFREDNGNFWFETYSPTYGDYYSVWSGHQFKWNESEQYNEYTFCQRYYLVSILNNITDVFLGYKNKDVSLCSNVRNTTSNVYNYSTYDTIQDIDSNSIHVTNNIKGDAYYNLYNMVFTDYNYDIQDSFTPGAHPICTFHNRYFIPLRIPSYSRMNPHFRYGEKGTNPSNWIANATKYNKDSYDLSFLKSNNFRINSISDDSLFKITHYFNYIFKSNVYTGINRNIGWRNFTFIDSTNKPNFKIFPSEKGEGVAINCTDKILYVQSKDTLFLLQYKDKLTNEVVLAERDILEAPYDEFSAQCKTGKIGAAYRRCATLTPVGYFVIDLYARTVHLVSDKYINCNIDYSYDNELTLRIDKMITTNQLTIDDINKICTIGYDSKLQRIVFSFKYNEYIAQTIIADFNIDVVSTINRVVSTEKQLIKKNTIDTEFEDKEQFTELSAGTTYRYVYDDSNNILPISGTQTITLPDTEIIVSDSTTNTISELAAPPLLYQIIETIAHTIERVVNSNGLIIVNSSVVPNTLSISNNILIQLQNVLPIGYTNVLELMQYYTINYIGDILLNTININRVYIGATINYNGVCDFLYETTPFYPIVANVVTTSVVTGSTYYFLDIEKLIKVQEVINTVQLTGTILLNASTQLVTLLGETPTQIKLSLFQKLLNVAMNHSDFKTLSRDGLYNNTFSDIANNAIYLGTITRSDNVILNPLDPKITEFNITVKYLLLSNIADYFEDVYFDLYVKKDEGVILKVYVTDIYTMRMKYADNHTLTDPSVVEYTIHNTSISSIVTPTTYTNINIQVYEYYTQLVTATITSTYSLYLRVYELLVAYNNNINIISTIAIGTVFSVTTPLDGVIFVNGLYISIHYELTGDDVYTIYITDIGKYNMFSTQTYDTYSLIPGIGFISKHDYIGNIYLNSRYHFNVIDNNITYVQNGNKLHLMPYSNKGTVQIPSWSLTYKPFYIDIVMNFNDNMLTLDNVMWVAKLLSNNGLTQEYTKSITHICIYTDKQCSGLIPFNVTQTSWFDKNIPAYTNGEFRFNNFRDMVAIENSPIFDDDGLIYDKNHPLYNTSGIPLTVSDKNNKKWFDNSFIISKFAVVRMYLDSTTNSFTNKTLKLINVALTGKLNNR